MYDYWSIFPPKTDNIVVYLCIFPEILIVLHLLQMLPVQQQVVLPHKLPTQVTMVTQKLLFHGLYQRVSIIQRQMFHWTVLHNQAQNSVLELQLSSAPVQMDQETRGNAHFLSPSKVGSFELDISTVISLTIVFRKSSLNFAKPLEHVVLLLTYEWYGKIIKM